MQHDVALDSQAVLGSQQRFIKHHEWIQSICCRSFQTLTLETDHVRFEWTQVEVTGRFADLEGKRKNKALSHGPLHSVFRWEVLQRQRLSRFIGPPSTAAPLSALNTPSASPTPSTPPPPDKAVAREMAQAPEYLGKWTSPSVELDFSQGPGKVSLDRPTLPKSTTSALWDERTRWQPAGGSCPRAWRARRSGKARRSTAAHSC